MNNLQNSFQFGIESQGDDRKYLQEQLITYIGNKRALLPAIERAVLTVKSRVGKSSLRCLDLFSGTGVVSRLLKRHSDFVVANDLELYSKVTNECYLSNTSSINWKEVGEAHAWLKEKIRTDFAPGWIAEMYAPSNDLAIENGERAFYTRRNASYLDSARVAIGLLEEPFRTLFLAPLIAKASVHANTSGVFKGFYKDREGRGQFGGQGKNALARIMKPIEIEPPILSSHNCAYEVFQDEASNLIQRIGSYELDLVYLDPPYNQHPYGSNYFMLNLLASYSRPDDVSDVSGIPVKWNRSKYNQKKLAGSVLLDAIESCCAPYVLISYNSEGFISKDYFINSLEKLGKLSIIEMPYNTFRGSRNLRERPIYVTEYLFLLEK